MRLVYVMPTPADGDLRSRLERWPTVHGTLRSLAETGAIEAIGLCDTAVEEPPFDLDGVRYEPRRHRSVLGWAWAARRLRPDVVHLQGVGSSRLVLAMRVALGPRVAIVVQHHGERPEAIRSRLLRRLADLAVDVYAFTGGSEQAQPFVDAHLLTRSVVDVLEASTGFGPVDVAEARRSTGIDGSPAVLWVGRDTPGKDLDTVMRAFAMLRESHPAARLHLLQTEPLRPDRHPLPDGVHAKGPVPLALMPRWYSAADLLVSASRHEGSGYAVIEAIACASPVVLSDIPSFRSIAAAVCTAGSLDGADPRHGIDEDVADRRPVLLVPTGRAEAMAAAMRQLANRPPSRSATRAAFEAHLSWNAVADQLLSAYSRSLRRRDASPTATPTAGRSTG